MTAPRPREPRRPPAPPDRLPSHQGGQPSYKTESAAARRAFLRSTRTLAAAACLAFSGALALPPTAEAQTDTTPPTLSRAVVDGAGTSVTVIFSEDLDLQSQTLSDAVIGAFTVTADDVELEVGSVLVGLLEDLVLVIVSSTPIYPGQTVVVSYNQSVAGGDALADAAGNEVASFTTGSGGVPAVTNNSPAARARPGLSVWDAAASDGSNMAFTVTLSEAAAEEVTATWTASIEFGNTAVEADLGRTTTGMVTFAPNATTARFVLRLRPARRREDRTFRVTLSNPSSNAQLVSNWIATGTIIGLPTSCRLNPGDIWCGRVTVEEKAQLNGKTLGHGFHQTWHTDGVGGLPDRRFVYGADSYRIDEVTVGVGGGDIPAGFLFFSMNRAFPVADEVRLALYVGNDEFKLSRAHGPHNAPTYHWRDTGLDWSSTRSVTLRLRGDITAAAHTEDPAAPLTASARSRSR